MATCAFAVSRADLPKTGVTYSIGKNIKILTHLSHFAIFCDTHLGVGYPPGGG